MKYIKCVFIVITLIWSISAEDVDGKCGEGYGSCDPDECCSKYGWCGTSEEHCGSGCQI